MLRNSSIECIFKTMSMISTARFHKILKITRSDYSSITTCIKNMKHDNFYQFQDVQVYWESIQS